MYLRGRWGFSISKWRRARSARQVPAAGATTEGEVSTSAQGDHMAANHDRAQQGVDARDVPPVGISPCSEADALVVLNTVTDDGFTHRRADDLDTEAAYYRHRAIQEEQALGPGYYVDLLRGMATDQAALAQRIRT